MFIKKLSSETSGKFITHWQIAEDGMWENAKHIPVSPNPVEIKDLMDWVLNAPSDLALEAFFSDKHENFFFYGLRIKAMPKKEQQLFLISVLNRVSKESSLDDLIMIIEKNLKGMPILKSSPDLMELGAEGFWKSYGSYVVWTKEQKSKAEIKDIECDAPQLLKPFERSMIMEFAWHHPIPMWIGCPISKKKGQLYEFSLDRYNKLLNFVSL